MATINDEHWGRIHYEQFIEELTGYYDEDLPKDIVPLIEKIQVLEQFSLDNKRIFCLFSQVDFYFIYISKNIEQYLGFSPEELYKGGLPLAFNITYWKQLPMAVKVHIWGHRFQNLVKNDIVGEPNQETFFCGLKIKNKKGKLITFCIKQRVLSFSKKNKPLLSFLEVEEVTTIFKADFMWARFTAKYKNKTYCRAYFSTGKKKEYADLLSTREMEILKLAAEQKNNTEICELLGISKHTVERHRKNMIAKAGVIDMTGLIHVCRLCQIL